MCTTGERFTIKRRLTRKNAIWNYGCPEGKVWKPAKKSPPYPIRQIAQVAKSKNKVVLVFPVKSKYIERTTTEKFEAIQRISQTIKDDYRAIHQNVFS